MGRQPPRTANHTPALTAWVLALVFLSYQVEGKFGPWAAAGAVVAGLLVCALWYW